MFLDGRDQGMKAFQDEWESDVYEAIFTMVTPRFDSQNFATTEIGPSHLARVKTYLMTRSQD